MKKLLMAMLALISIVTASFAVACGGGLKLGAPTNVRYDGSVITWDKVDGADLYTLTIGEREYAVTTNRYSYNANGKEFTVTIKASSKTEKVDSQEEAIQTFIPLAKIEVLNVTSEGVVSWNNIDEATAYEVSIDNGTPVEQAETTFASMPEGTHTIKVRPIVSGDPAYYSLWSDSKSMTMLGKLTANDITYSNVDRRISWKVVTGAQYYEVMVNGVVVEERCSGTALMYEAGNTDFQVSIRALGNGSTTFNGKVSENKGFVFLDTVSNVRVEEGVLMWDPVNGADGYKVRQNGVIRPETFTTCELANIPANTALTFEILPISNDSAYFSDWSVEKSVHILEAPILAWNDAMEHEGEEMESITWDTIAGANGYTAKVTLPDGTPAEYHYPETQRYYKNAYLATGKYIIQIKATASVGKDDSKYSDPIVVERLEAPRQAESNYIISDVNDVQNGFTVTFKGVSGAAGYNLYKDGNLIKTAQTTSFKDGDVVNDAVITEQNYNYQIQAVAGDSQKINGTTYATLSSLKAESLSFNIKVLAQPATPTIEGYNYTYGTISNAMGYVVKVGEQANPSANTNYDLSYIEAGSFPVSVCAKGNGTNVLSSNYTGAITVNRLEAPTNVRIDTSDASGGALTWDNVLHATSYEIVFNNDGNPIPAEEMMNVNQYITTQGTTVYMQTIANYFNTEKTIYYMTSKPGLTTQFMKLDTPTFGDVKFNNNQFIWNLPSNVKGAEYTPTYKVYNGNGSTYNGNMNGTTLDISQLEGGKSYSFYVKAIGNGVKYINSEVTETVSIYKLATPDVKRVDGKYVWNRIVNAQSYVIYVDGKLAQTYDHLDGTTEKYEYTPKFDKVGEYQITVIAIGDGGYTSIDSTPCVFTQVTKQLSTPEFSVSYSENSYSTTGKIVVTITKPAYYVDGTTATTGEYAYFIAGVEQTTTELTASQIPNSAGKYSVAVYACAGTFDDGGIYYLQSQTAGSKTETAITLLLTPNASEIYLSGEGFIEWATITGAVKYELRFAVNGGSYGEVVYASQNTYNFYDDYMQDGDEVITLKIEIRAIGNGNNIISSTTVEKQFDGQNLTK